MPCTLAELAKLVGGAVRGNANVVVTGAATNDVDQPGEITLADRPDRARQLAASDAAIARSSGWPAPGGLAWSAAAG